MFKAAQAWRRQNAVSQRMQLDLFGVQF